jgi:hypothetical protein
MTIKTQNGKVITKDGKVSCECCEEPPTPIECCLYNGLAFIDGLYAVEDLPNSIIITINGSKNTLSKTGDDFPNAIYSGESDEFAIEVYSGWRVYLNLGEEDEQFFDFNCLVDDSFSPGEGATASVTETEDQFADTYTASYGGIQFVGPANRQSLCFWQSDECQSPNRWSWAIQYGTLEEPYKWAVFLEEPGDGECIPAGFFIKNDPQNSPAGTYSNGTQTLTVS